MQLPKGDYETQPRNKDTNPFKAHVMPSLNVYLTAILQ